MFKRLRKWFWAWWCRRMGGLAGRCAAEAAVCREKADEVGRRTSEDATRWEEWMDLSVKREWLARLFMRASGVCPDGEAEADFFRDFFREMDAFNRVLRRFRERVGRELTPEEVAEVYDMWEREWERRVKQRGLDKPPGNGVG